MGNFSRILKIKFYSISVNIKIIKVKESTKDETYSYTLITEGCESLTNCQGCGVGKEFIHEGLIDLRTRSIKESRKSRTLR